jgi:hypothetical protein
MRYDTQRSAKTVRPDSISHRRRSPRCRPEGGGARNVKIRGLNPGQHVYRHTAWTCARKFRNAGGGMDALRPAATPQMSA